MIRVNLLKDHTVPVEKKQPMMTASKMTWVGYVYIAAVVLVAAALGYRFIDSGNAIKQAVAENQSLERELKEMEALRRQFLELEQKTQERQGRINIIERLLESQKGPVKLMNAVIQAIPQSRDIWLTSLEQTSTGVKVRGETRIPEVVPDFMGNLKKSGIFTDVDIELIERRDEISSFSILLRQ